MYLERTTENVIKEVAERITVINEGEHEGEGERVLAVQTISTF